MFWGISRVPYTSVPLGTSCTYVASDGLSGHHHHDRGMFCVRIIRGILQRRAVDENILGNGKNLPTFSNYADHEPGMYNRILIDSSINRLFL